MTFLVSPLASFVAAVVAVAADMLKQEGIEGLLVPALEDEPKAEKVLNGEAAGGFCYACY